MRKVITLVTVGTVGFVAGAWYTASKICAMRRLGEDLNKVVDHCNSCGSAASEDLKVRMWRRKYSEVSR